MLGRLVAIFSVVLLLSPSSRADVPSTIYPAFVLTSTEGLQLKTPLERALWQALLDADLRTAQEHAARVAAEEELAAHETAETTCVSPPELVSSPTLSQPVGFFGRNPELTYFLGILTGGVAIGGAWGLKEQLSR